MSREAKRQRKAAIRRGKWMLVHLQRHFSKKLAIPNSGLGVDRLAALIVAETGWSNAGNPGGKWNMLYRYGSEVLGYGQKKPSPEAKAARKLGHSKGMTFKKFNAFYLTKAWQRLRYEAFKKYGRKCQCCGATDRLHVDHIKPRSKYPELELDINNLQILCEDCNMGKGGWDETDWREPGQPEPLDELTLAFKATIN